MNSKKYLSSMTKKILSKLNVTTRRH